MPGTTTLQLALHMIDIHKYFFTLERFPPKPGGVCGQVLARFPH